MMDFGKMEMTHEQIEDGNYRIRVGNDIIEVAPWIDGEGFFRVATLDHYIKYRGNKPTNPNRTHALEGYAKEYMEDLYRKEVEEDLREIASLPATDGRLQKKFEGKHLYFFKGTSALEVIRKFEEAYDGACIWRTSKAVDILNGLSQEPDGFLSEELEERFAF